MLINLEETYEYLDKIRKGIIKEGLKLGFTDFDNHLIYLLYSLSFSILLISKVLVPNKIRIVVVIPDLYLIINSKSCGFVTFSPVVSQSRSYSRYTWWIY